MKHCVVKNTTKVIDGSENPIETMLQNAQNAGFEENEVEILTEEEYQIRKDAEPVPPVPPAPPTTEERLEATEQALMAMMEVL